MKKRYLIGNLKMNLSTPEEAERYVSVLAREAGVTRWPATVVSVAPPFIHLARFRKGLPESIELAAQDVFYEKEGSFTGEVSATMLRSEGVRQIIVGHSERRLCGGETDEVVAAKLAAVLKQGMVPVLCVGETEEERGVGKTADVVARQVRTALDGVSPLQAEKVVIAYEPRWAIGTDRTPNSDDILGVRALIKKTLSDLYRGPVADRVAILYGGSVKASLLDEVCFRAQMDGVLVGRESLFPSEVVRMANAIDAAASLAGDETDKS